MVVHILPGDQGSFKSRPVRDRPGVVGSLQVVSQLVDRGINMVWFECDRVGTLD